MSRGIIILLFSLLPICSQAQHEWAPIGAIWFVNEMWFYEPINDPLYDYFTVEVTGDTVIGGHVGRKVGDYITVQDGDQVYLWWQDTLRLIYDYSLQAGDSVTFSLLNCDKTANPEVFIVEKVDTILVDNLPLKQFYTFSWYGPNQMYYYEYVYIEKIGTPDLPILDRAYCFYTSDTIPTWMRCYRDAEIYYRSSWFNFLDPNLECDYALSVNIEGYESFNLFPNPASAFARLELGALSNHQLELTVHVFNAFGQILFTGVIPSHAKSYDIPLSSISSGVYLLKLIDSEGVTIGMNKLVVE